MPKHLKSITFGLIVLSLFVYLMCSHQTVDEPRVREGSQRAASPAGSRRQEGGGPALFRVEQNMAPRIHARVVNTATAKGVRATVCLAQDVVPSPIDCYPTDSEGEVEITAPAIQRAFRLWASAPGFAPAVSPPPPQSPIAALTNGVEVLLEVTPSTRTLAGVVLDGSGGPVPGATLEIRTPLARNSICMSGDEGRFRCTLQEHLDSVAISVTADGYAGIYWPIALPAEDLRIRLFAESSISGRVVDTSERPLPDVEVRIKPSLVDMRWWTISTQTNSQGLFHFQGLRPGNYRVYAASGHYSSELSPNEVSLGYMERREDVVIRVVEGRRVRVWLGAEGGLPCGRPIVVLSTEEKAPRRYAGAPVEGLWFEISGVPDGTYSLLLQCENHIDEVKTLRISADLEIRHEAKSGGVIRGVVYDHTGKSVPEAYVKAGEESVQTDSEGRFVVGGLPWGKVEIEASHRRLGSRCRQTTQIAPNASPPELRLVLERGYCIEGIVERKGVAGRLIIDTSQHAADVQSDGHFELCGVSAGDRLGLRVRGDDGLRVFRVADSTLDHSVVDLLVPEQGAPSPAIRLEVEDEFTSARGSVRETTGEGVSEVLITMHRTVSSEHICTPASAVSLQSAVAATHADGEFSIDSVRAGRYMVHAFAPDGRTTCAFMVIPDTASMVLELPPAAPT